MHAAARSLLTFGFKFNSLSRRDLIAEGKPFTLAIYPGAEHRTTEYELNAKGERVSTRYAPDYFAMMRDFIRDGRLHGPYGMATITGPPN